MLRWCVRILICLAAGMLVAPASVMAQCGVERWQVKTGSDSDAYRVNLNSTTSTTINNLRGVPAPNPIPEDSRVAPTETTVFVLDATLKKFMRSYDSDYHMVLADELGRTIIAEIPSPNCVAPGSPLAAGIAHARAQFDALFNATTIFQTVNVPVRITGVGFFDYAEGQEGLAPNAIEIHPVIDIIFNPFFQISASPEALTVAQGSMVSSTITSTLTSNFNSSVMLTASGLPGGATASFSPLTISAPGGGSSMLMILAGAATPAGNYQVTVTGAGGGQINSTVLSLNITSGGGTQLLGNPGFENGSTNPAPWTVTQGVIDNSGFEASHTGSWKGWLDGYGSAHTDTISQTVSVPAGASAATLSFWLHIDTLETSTSANDTLKLQIRNSSGAVLSTLATFSNRDAASGYRQFTYDLSSFKGQTIQIYLVGAENSQLKTSFVVDDFALNASTASTADFGISGSPSVVSIARGGSASVNISTSASGGFNSSIALSASGWPTNVTARFAPSSIGSPGTGSSTLSLLAGSSTALGNYNVTVSGSGGGKTHTTMIGLSVVAGGGSVQQLLGNPGFENGAANPSPWTVTSGVIDNSVSEPAHAGAWKAWLNGYGSTHTDTLVQTMSIPSNATTANLSFWLHIDTTETTATKAYDTLQVQVRNSSGTVLATLATYSNLTVISSYTQVSFNLASYKGQTIQIYLIGTEDSSLKTSFVVDDFALNVTQ